MDASMNLGQEVWKQMQPLLPLMGVTLVGMLGTLILGKFLRTIVVSIASTLVKKTDNKIDDQLLQVAEEDLGVKPIELNSKEEEGDK